MLKSFTFILIFILSLTAQSAEFKTGPVIKSYGKNVVVENGLMDPEQQKFKVVFDVSKVNEQGEVNGSFNTVARFINMHVRAGVPIENIEVALVVHGKAGFDLLTPTEYKKLFAKANKSADLVNELFKANVDIYLCGQSASYLGITQNMVNPEVKLALSAMTANALLQQQGYTLNPF
ncbi:DsrE family protein [Thalassomonas sp. M1454]|uniref:DsrE family protein n=1 Tax=Thalassomonas sp. M1454 TaxID=2594477 RepID=UPI00117FEBC7|nr:DsrE family protein [Thalassomonas sp. M1454]TRX53858.1 DsrE family protein [Thalassomonas sp. M1454]